MRNDMKTNKGWVGMSLWFMLLCVAVEGYSQTDAAAKSILDKMSNTYKGFTAVQADFSVMVKQGPQGESNFSEEGTVLIAPTTGKYHITTGSQDLISDGKTTWTVLKDIKEVQVTDADYTSSSISPVNLFSFYTKGYKYVSASDERAGSTSLQVVELSPEDRRSPYHKIKLRVNKSTNLIHDLTIFDKNGARYTYVIKNTKSVPSVTAEKFTFQQSQYPGIEVVDLR